MRCMILCGGSGTRLWPYSTENKPKQFLNLVEEKTLLQSTFERAKAVSSDISIISNNSFSNLIEEQLKGENYSSLLEPCRKDTAAAICISILLCEDDEIVLVLPSDHYISTIENFKISINEGLKFANDNIVTFGICPTYPETGYGYIESINKKVVRFVEKPNIIKAKEFIETGNFYWNSGMFLFRAGLFKEEMKKYNEDFFIRCSECISGRWGLNSVHVPNEKFRSLKAQPIDIALMEKTDKLKMICAQFKWSDVGSWKSISLLDLTRNDEKITEVDNESCLIKSDCKNKKKIVCIGLKNICVVETDECLLVMDMDSSSKLKSLGL